MRQGPPFKASRSEGTVGTRRNIRADGVGMPVVPPTALLPGGGETRMGDVPAPGSTPRRCRAPWGWRTTRSQRCAGTVWRPERGLLRDARVAGAGRNAGVAQRPPNSERRSRRSGAKSETPLTRAPLSERSCAALREVSSRISKVASAVSRCGTAGPASTERWRSSRELVALFPQTMAGTLALLRTVICSMSLPTRTSPPGPGRVTLSPPRGTRVSRAQDSPSL